MAGGRPAWLLPLGPPATHRPTDFNGLGGSLQSPHGDQGAELVREAAPAAKSTPLGSCYLLFWFSVDEESLFNDCSVRQYLFV